MIVSAVSSRPTTPWPSPSAGVVAAHSKATPPAFAAVEATEAIPAGTADVSRGSIGITFFISHDEIEVDFYEPRHVFVLADASQLQVR